MDKELLFPRKTVQKITGYLDTPEIILLIGARQVGKTSILYLLMDELRRKKVSDSHIHYFDLEDLDTLQTFNRGAKEFIAYLGASGSDTKSKNYIFVDEIQYMDNPTNFLKIIADHYHNFKLIVSGSSTLEIKRKFKDSLAGRKIVFEVYPLDFYEYLIFKKEDALCRALLKSDVRHMDIKTDIKNIPVHNPTKLTGESHFT